METFPVEAMPLNALFYLICLILHTSTGILSTEEMLVHFHKQRVLRNSASGIRRDATSNCVNLSQDTVLGNSFLAIF